MIVRAVPPEVNDARRRGKPVAIQGDWFFYPERLPPRAKLFHFHPLGDDHIAERVAVPAELTNNVFVIGIVTHREHPTLCFHEWHRAVRRG